MTTFGDLARKYTAIASGIPERMNRVVQQFALVLDLSLVDFTTVDTAEARSNWVASVNVPILQPIPPYFPYPKGSGGGGQRGNERANWAAAQIQAQRVIAARRPGQDIYLSNARDAITIINQEHDFFVQAAVRRSLRFFSTGFGWTIVGK